MNVVKERDALCAACMSNQHNWTMEGHTSASGTVYGVAVC